MNKGPAWENWISAVFKFHLTVEPPEIDEIVREYIFNFSNGNPDAAVSLFTTAQELALSAGREQVQWGDYRKARKYLYMRDPEMQRTREVPRNKLATIGQNSHSSAPIEDPVADLSKVEEEPAPLR